MTAQIVIDPPTDECEESCAWCSANGGVHIHEVPVFAGLRNVPSDRLDAVLDGFTREQWTGLAQGFLDQLYGDVMGYLDVLDFDFDPDTDDAFDIFVRILRRYDQTLPIHQQTTGGIR